MTLSISVVIPTYNAAETIVDTVRSVANQQYPPVEILVVDDCSTDETYLKLQFLQEEIKSLIVLRTEKNFGGPAGPRNIGLERASGDYVAFLDSDDLWHPDLLSVYSNYLEIGYSMISSTKFPFKNANIFTNNYKNISNSVKDENIKHRMITYSDLLSTNLIVNSSAIIERKKLLKIMFKESKKFVAVEDFIAWCNIHKSYGDSLQLDLKMVGYRLHPNSLSANKFKMIKKRIMALRALGLTELEIMLRIVNFAIYRILGVFNVK